MAIHLPFNMQPTSVRFSKAGTSRTGGRSISGSQQVVRSDCGYWQASMSFVIGGGRKSETSVLTYRAWYAALEGMAGEVLVPAITAWRPYGMDGKMISASGGGEIGGANTFHNHALFGLTEPEIVRVRVPAAMGATRMIVTHNGSEGLRPGHYFGIGERLYLVSRAWALDYERPVAVGGGMTYGGEVLTYGGEELVYGAISEISMEGENILAIDFWPRLREAVPAGAPLVLGRPVCKMRMASDDTGSLTHSQHLPSAVSLDFDEVY